MRKPHSSSPDIAPSFVFALCLVWRALLFAEPVFYELVQYDERIIPVHKIQIEILREREFLINSTFFVQCVVGSYFKLNLKSRFHF